MLYFDSRTFYFDNNCLFSIMNDLYLFSAVSKLHLIYFKKGHLKIFRKENKNWVRGKTWYYFILIINECYILN